MKNLRSYNFYVPVTPMSKQSVRKGKNKMGKDVYYQPKKHASYRYKIQYYIKQSLPRDFVLFEKIVFIDKLVYSFPPTQEIMRKKADRAIIERGGYIYKLTKPDLGDNLNKPVLDALNNVLYSDDARVCFIAQNAKVYTKQRGIYLSIRGE